MSDQAQAHYPPFSGLTGIAFIEDFVDDLRHLEDGFAVARFVIS